MPPDTPRLTYKRGHSYPRAIAWFGARSFWGHLWHLAASVIATEDIDSRAWMRPSSPDELTRKIIRVLGGNNTARSLTEALDRDLWIDFISDTGDCVSVSQAVAEMMFAEYEVSDPKDPTRSFVLPRGDVLLFGGDTAYPVATELEIHNRVIVPFSRVLNEVSDGKKRALIGIPGNHDWYAGLDGFGRMFRERHGIVGLVEEQPPNEVVRFAQIGHFIKWVEAFRVGRFVGKRSTLPLEGYVPVQDASYFGLRLAPGLDLWGPDRQLRAVDFQQRAFFAQLRDEGHGRGLVLVMADPAQAFCEPSQAGVDICCALDVDLKSDGVLVLSGDTHHYCREEVGRSVHVTAGGGGAFLHPARIARRSRDLRPPVAEFPGPKTSLALALQIPFQILHGRSGFLVHLGVGLLYVPGFFMRFGIGYNAPLAEAIGTAAVAGFLCKLLGGWRRLEPAFFVLAAIAGILVGVVPFVAQAAVTSAANLLRVTVGWTSTVEVIGFLLSIYLGTLIFGTYLTVLTILGLEQHQAFSALAHPGYKHFVRLRVRRDGSAIDAWVLGKVDPLREGDPVVLVDRFTWRNSPLPVSRRTTRF